jgi:hypothetical protein
LHENLEQALDAAEIVVIGHAEALYARDEQWRAQGKIVLRLT